MIIADYKDERISGFHSLVVKLWLKEDDAFTSPLTLTQIHSFKSAFSDKQSLISQILKPVGHLAEKFKFFISLGIQIKMDFNYTNTRIKLHSCKALK